MKVKFTFKATDSIEQVVDDFLRTKGYYNQHLGFSIFLYTDEEHPVVDSVVRGIEIDMANHIVYAADYIYAGEDVFDDTGDIIYLDNDELEFFDRLGFELHSNMTKRTKQEITDWYGIKDE